MERLGMAGLEHEERNQVVAMYEWKSNAPTPPVTADVFGKELERIAAGDPFELVDLDALWKSARNPSSPIHSCWDWNLRSAAEAHWRAHARHLIGQLTIARVHVTAKRPLSDRAWFSVRIKDRRGYMSQEKVLGERDLRHQVIAAAKDDLQLFIARYHRVLGFGRVIPGLQTIIANIQTEIDRLATVATT
jgi:hypothetical protein